MSGGRVRDENEELRMPTFTFSFRRTVCWASSRDRVAFMWYRWGSSNKACGRMEWKGVLYRRRRGEEEGVMMRME